MPSPLRTALLTPRSFLDEVLYDRPIAGWRLGLTANDWFGGNNGTFTNSPTLGVVGALNGDSQTATTFNGTTQYVSVTDAAAIDQGNGPLSWECWYKKTDTVGGTMMSKGSNAPILQVVGSGNILWYSRATALAVHAVLAAANTAWHHVVGTKTSGNVWLIYLDGVDATVSDGAGPATGNTATNLELGRDASSVDTQFKGTLQEAWIYNTVLTPGRVLAHYRASGYS